MWFFAFHIFDMTLSELLLFMYIVNFLILLIASLKCKYIILK